MPPRCTADPVNDLLELLGHRWTLRVLWELRDGPMPYRRLRDACGGLSTSVLSQRLRELSAAGLVEHPSEGYALTPLGSELGEEIVSLGGWARRWARAGEGRRREEVS
jgi:DNA-binding HxlR family transcriptional regulator